jgi:crossover junction endodeoxyribonuclease RusA
MTTPAISLNAYFGKQGVSSVPAVPQGVVVYQEPDVQRIQLPAPPTANLYWRVFRGRVVKSKAAREYGATVWKAARQQKARAIKAPAEVCISITWTRSAKRGDLDNRLKVVIDALKGLAWSDDKQIRSIHAERSEGSCDSLVVSWWAA